MSNFDPDTFLDTAVDTELSTEFIPVPEGEYVAVIDDLQMKPTRKGGMMVMVKWSIDDAAVASETGRDNNTVTQMIFLDLTAEGQLDTAKGKNIKLGKLRDVFNQNSSGHSLRELLGNSARIMVTHTASDDGEMTYTNVNSVTAL